MRWIVLPCIVACGRIGFDAAADHVGTDATADTSASDLDTDPALLAWWRLESDPGQGAIDSSGNGHHATCTTGCAIQVSGRVGTGAYQFSSDFYQLPDPGAFQTPAGFTVAGWIRLDAMSTYAAVTKSFGTMQANTWALGTSAINDPSFCTSSDATNTECDPGMPDLVVGTWTHVAGTWDATTMAKVLYVDGELVTTAQRSIVFDSSDIVLGCDLEDGGLHRNFLQGSLDDVRIYGRPLAGSEIAELAAR